MLQEATRTGTRWGRCSPETEGGGLRGAGVPAGGGVRPGLVGPLPWEEMP